MPNKHCCQGPICHERTTQDRFLKSRGVIRGRYANRPKDDNSGYYDRGKYFCSTNCESLWLDEHMQHIEQGRPIELSDTGERVGVMKNKLMSMSMVIVRELIQGLKLKGLTMDKD